MPQIIERTALQARLAGQSQPILVEALPRKYFDAGHLPGARHMPHDQTRELATTLLPDTSAAIVVYCASDTCQNSHIAARVLEQLGYTDVAVYAGGKKDWSDAGLPLEQASIPQAA